MSLENMLTMPNIIRHKYISSKNPVSIDDDQVCNTYYMKVGEKDIHKRPAVLVNLAKCRPIPGDSFASSARAPVTIFFSIIS